MRNSRLLFGVILCLIFTTCSSVEKKTSGKEGDSNNLKSTDHPSGSNMKRGAKAGMEPVTDIKLTRQITYCSTENVVVGDIAKFAVNDRNRVFIADMDQTTIHVFNPDGHYLTFLGRQGKGPGEFAAVSPNTTMVVHLDRLYVTDTEFYFPHRAHVYALEDLSFSHTMKLLAGNSEDYKELEGYYPKRIYALRDGRFLVAYHRSPHEYKDAESFIRYVIQDSTGIIVSGPLLEQKDLTYLIYISPTNLTTMHSFPFSGKSLLSVSDEGHLYAANNTEKFEIDVYDARKGHIRTFQHPFNNVPLTRSGIIERYRHNEDVAWLGESVLKMIRGAETLPEIWPALETMLFDDENRLWISTIVDDFEVYEWWVLKTTGEVITKFKWPRAKPIEVVNNGYLYTRETDENGITSIVRYNIENFPL